MIPVWAQPNVKNILRISLAVISTSLFTVILNYPLMEGFLKYDMLVNYASFLFLVFAYFAGIVGTFFIIINKTWLRVLFFAPHAWLLDVGINVLLLPTRLT